MDATELDRRLRAIQLALAPERDAAPVLDATPEASLSAGPFASVSAVRRFTAMLEQLDEVRSAELREYEVGNRAVIEVQLAPPNA